VVFLWHPLRTVSLQLFFVLFGFCFSIGYSCACSRLKVELYLAHFAGSKEETFFDSQAWLESDCEDDYFSVNGGKNTNVLSHLSFKHGS
jgi:hypothetical protein